jgi:hypothetical protein
MPGARCTREPHAQEKQHAHKGSQGTETSGIPCAMILRLLRALPGVPGFLATIACGNLPQTWLQHRGARTTRLDRPLVPRTPCEETSGHRSLSRVRGDHDPPLLMDRMRGNLPVFCPTAKAIYFFPKGWTGGNSLKSQRKSDFRRRPKIETKSTAKPGI